MTELIMEIKPIRVIIPVTPADIPESRVDGKRNRTPLPTQPPEGKWQFFNGRIVLNGQDVATILENAKNKPQAFWTKLASDLAAYREYFIAQNSKKRRKKVGDKEVIEEYDPTGEIEHLCALVEAYIGKIIRHLKRKYDETADGLSYFLDEDGQLIINGMNVTSFILMARNYPSKKARIFLRGLKNRLSIILSNKTGSLNYEKIRDVTEALFKEIDLEMNRIVEKDRLIENT